MTSLHNETISGLPTGGHWNRRYNNIVIVNNTADNYRECLDITKPTWKGEKDLYRLEGQTFNQHCTNKIKSMISAIEKSKGQNLIYLDTDVMMRGELKDTLWTHDILVTRMVNRPERPHYPFINAGVFLMKANDKTLRFCREWLELDKEYQKNPNIAYPEQQALNDLVYKYYDSETDITVGNISENIYNFERDDDKAFIKDFQKYNPRLVHLKGKKWQNNFIMDFVNKQGML